MSLGRAQVRLRRAWTAARAAIGRPAVRAAVRNAPPGLFHVVVPPRVLDTYDETVHGIVETLFHLGRRAVVHCVARMESVGPLRPCDRVLVFGAHRFEPWRPPPGVLLIGVNVEHYPPGWRPDGASASHMEKTQRFLAACDLRLESNECLFERSAEIGWPAAGVLPFAATSRFVLPPLPAEAPLHDVAFLGRISTLRRRVALAELAGQFRLAPTHVAWGRRRVEFLRSAAIQLNLHQGDEPVLEGHRFALAFGASAFLLSEPLPPNAPFIAGVHFVEAPLADWPDVIRHWLARPEERRAIAEAGARHFRARYTLATALERLLPVLDGAAERGISAVAE
jgi:hypothetical protein